MTRQNANRKIDIRALSLALVYSAIVVLHLFFIPVLLAGVRQNAGFDFQRNTKGIYTLLRNDRTTLTENKNGHSAPKSLLLFVVSLAAGLGVLYKWSSKNVQPVQVSSGKRYSYLTCRVIRI